MVLAKDRQGDIAFNMLLTDALEEGITLKPKELKREIVNRAKKYGTTPAEMAQITKLGILEATHRSVLILDAIIAANLPVQED
jgi:hypothetical protein